jgi:hypothetical protein
MSAFGAFVGTATDTILGRSNARKGASIDNKSYQQRDQYDWQMAKDRGLTPQEFYGSSASGGSSTSGSGAVLGNASTNANIADKISRQEDRKIQERAQDTQLAAAKISADASIKSSEISAGANRYSSDKSYSSSTYSTNINKAIADQNFSLQSKSFKQVTLPAAAANLKKTEQETQVIINNVVTSTDKFKRSQLLLSMGVDNSVNTMLQKRFGVDITSQKQMQNLSEDQFRNVLAVFMAAGSHVNRELQGLLSSSPFGTPKQFQLNPFKKNQSNKKNLGQKPRSKTIGRYNQSRPN